MTSFQDTVKSFISDSAGKFLRWVWKRMRPAALRGWPGAWHLPRDGGEARRVTSEVLEKPSKRSRSLVLAVLPQPRPLDALCPPGPPGASSRAGDAGVPDVRGGTRTLGTWGAEAEAGPHALPGPGAKSPEEALSEGNARPRVVPGRGRPRLLHPRTPGRKLLPGD